jgi:hypothetical protein
MRTTDAAIRAGTKRRGRSRRASTPTFDLGRSAVPIDKALRLAADLEDEELIRKLAARPAPDGASLAR